MSWPGRNSASSSAGRGDSGRAPPSGWPGRPAGASSVALAALMSGPKSSAGYGSSPGSATASGRPRRRDAHGREVHLARNGSNRLPLDHKPRVGGAALLAVLEALLQDRPAPGRPSPLNSQIPQALRPLLFEHVPLVEVGDGGWRSGGAGVPAADEGDAADVVRAATRAWRQPRPRAADQGDRKSARGRHERGRPGSGQATGRRRSGSWRSPRCRPAAWTSMA